MPILIGVTLLTGDSADPNGATNSPGPIGVTPLAGGFAVLARTTNLLIFIGRGLCGTHRNVYFSRLRRNDSAGWGPARNLSGRLIFWFIGVTPLGGASCYSIGTTIGMTLLRGEPRAPNWNEYSAELYRNDYFSQRRRPCEPHRNDKFAGFHQHYAIGKRLFGPHRGS